jgi:hypothetical protein
VVRDDQPDAREGQAGRRGDEGFVVPLKPVRRHLVHAQKRQGFDWERWNRRWLYDTLGLFNAYRARRDGPKVAPAG